MDDVHNVLRAGADKVAVNTEAFRRPEFISEIAERYGSQCVVAQVDAKKVSGGWVLVTENGRESTTKDIIDWVSELEDLGAGEILLTSIDFEGTGKGFDYSLVTMVAGTVSVPVIVSGGFGKVEHAIRVLSGCGAHAIAIADAFHYQKVSVTEIKEELNRSGISVRT